MFRGSDSSNPMMGVPTTKHPWIQVEISSGNLTSPTTTQNQKEMRKTAMVSWPYHLLQNTKVKSSKAHKK